MRPLIPLAGLLLFAHPAQAAPSADQFFEKLAALTGTWRADLPGFGKMTNSIRLVSNGKAIEESIGTPTDNETSIYSKDGNRLVLTHFCAMTPDGHVARLESDPIDKPEESLSFKFHSAINLHSPKAPHMRQVVLKILDRDHFEEIWTKTENGRDTVFALNFVRE